MLQASLVREIAVFMVLLLSMTLINGQDPSMGSSSAIKSSQNDDCTSDSSVVTGSTIAPSTTKIPDTTIIPTTVRAKQTTRTKTRTTPKPKICYFEADPDTTFDCEVVNRWIDCISRNIFRVPEICEFSTSSDQSSDSHLHYVSNRRFQYLLKHYFLIPISSNLPIYYHKDTYETFIMAPSGHIYVMPPLMNFFGQKYSVAHVIMQQYSSLSTNVVSQPYYYNIGPYFHSVPQASNTGAQSAGSGLYFDQKPTRDNGAVSPKASPNGPKYPSVLYY